MKEDQYNSISNDIISYFLRMSEEQYIKPERRLAYSDANKIYYNRVNTKEFLIGDLYGYDYSFLALYTYYKFWFLSYVHTNTKDVVSDFLSQVLKNEFKDKTKKELVFCIENVVGYEKVTGGYTIDFIENCNSPSLDFPDSIWEEVLKNWIIIKENEIIAYKLREIQHGKKNAQKFWYNDFPPFMEWASCVEKMSLNDDFFDMGDKIDETDLRSAKNVANNFVSEVISNYSDYRNKNEILSKRSILAIFLKNLIKKYNFDICDYLVVVDGRIVIRDYEIRYLENKENDVLIENTKELSSSLEQSETYTSTQGISGSILIPFDEELANSFHVGTNKLQDDCRQSPYHNSKYLELYGKGTLNDSNYYFHNFWVFPLFDEKDNIFAVFRVINKRDNKNAYSPLCKNERAELLNVAKWFQVVMRFIDTMSNYSIDSVSKEDIVWDNFDTDLNNNSKTKIGNFCNDIASLKLISDDQYESKRMFKLIMEHLIVTANRKIEHRSICCTLYFINSNDECWNPSNLEMLCNKTDTFGFDLDFDLVSQLYYGKHSYYNTVFVYTTDQKRKIGYCFQGILRLCLLKKDRVLRSFLAINALTEKNNNIICFTLDGNSKTIKILYFGKEQAQCYLSQSCGKWKIRIIEDTKKELFAKINVHLKKDKPKDLSRVLESYKDIVNLLFPILIYRSNNNQGAILIFDYEGNYKNSANSNWEMGYDININIEDFENFDSDQTYIEEFFSYMSLDGATIIESDKTAKKAGVILKTDKNNLTIDVKELLNRCGKGSRHTAAACIAKNHKNTLVFVVSENGGISIFMGDEILLFDW